MKREAIIHIGTMKTGSTSIQNVFNKYRGDILARGALFPSSPGWGAHQLLTYATVGLRRRDRNLEPAVWGGVEPEARLAQFEVEFKEEMENIPAHVDRVIFSDGRLSFLARTPADLGPLKEYLSPYFKKFTIIAYLRRQDSYLASRYSQLLRSGAVGEPDHRRTNTARLQEYVFQRLLNIWTQVFGEAAVKPRIYERGPDKKFDSVDVFIAACRLDLKVPLNDQARLANPSMNMAGQEVLREVGRVLQERTGKSNVGGPLWRRMTQAVTRALPGKGWLPTRAEAAEFMAMYEEANENVRRRFFPDRPTLFMDKSANFPVEPMQISDHDRFVAASAAFLEGMERGLSRESAVARKATITGAAKTTAKPQMTKAARAEVKAKRAELRREREERNKNRPAPN